MPDFELLRSYISNSIMYSVYNNNAMLYKLLCKCCFTRHALTLYRAREERDDLERTTSKEEASTVCEDTIHVDFQVQSDGRRMLTSTTPLVHRSHFYENFGDIDFWRKPSLSHPAVHEVPVYWTDPPAHVGKEMGKGRYSSDKADSSHQFTLSDTAVDAGQGKQSHDSAHPVQPKKRNISATLPIASREIDKSGSTDGDTASYYENAERVNGQMKGSSRRKLKESEDTEPHTLAPAGVVYERSYIPMHSAHCTSCPTLPDLEDGLYVAMDGTWSSEHTETNTNVKYYNVPAKIAGIQGTYFMPGPLYNLPSSRPVHPL